MATLKDVAQRAGVSTATVSHVLNDSKPVSQAVRERVLQAARELDYQRNRSAQTLRTGRSHSLGLILPDLTNPYFPALAQAIENKARALGYALLLIDANNNLENETAGMRLLAEHRVDGVIWIPFGDSLPRELPFPAVVVDRPVDGFDVIYADHYGGGRLLAEHALELGHQEIGLLVGPQTLPSARLRRAGVRDVLDGQAHVRWEAETPFALELSDAAKGRLAHADVTLVICANDVVAVGALQHCRTLGIRVPEELSLLGFDDIPWASLVHPRLSTIQQPIGALGEQAVTRLQERIANPALSPRHQRLPTTLLRRSSAIARSPRRPDQATQGSGV